MSMVQLLNTRYTLTVLMFYLRGYSIRGGESRGMMGMMFDVVQLAVKLCLGK